LETVCVISGGAGGMGLATAKIVGQSHGVLICDVQQEHLDTAAEELRALGVECETLRCDVTDRRSGNEMATQAQRLGKVVSVVHTAGVSPQMGTPEHIVTVNALGTVHVNEAFIPLAHEGFVIVNVASAAGHLPAAFPVPRRSYKLAVTDPDRFLRNVLGRVNLFPRMLRPGLAYAVSKNFVIWYSKSLAKRLGQRGARIVSVSPGSIDTEMGRLEEAAGAGALARKSSLGRFGRVEEIAEVLSFCASGKPGYLTGTDVLVDGGGRVNSRS
jgi:NAD(P)-dependent dehydrogenase (short-subunit alcohol dehydrogenase family)